ncbi:hypothetical protein [Kribbella caucasensis]|uniref:hypothetical protein n=1 Tax=Kribbella caucasensis TaxID=2512215 RepID=UPI00105C2E52|nr:hypothetical protein [Kribbella sp. VKM Ac-2527]
MTVTDYVGIAGLVAAALLALWMLLGATSPFHRGNSTPTTPTPPRHRGAPTGNLLHRILRRPHPIPAAPNPGPRRTRRAPKPGP